MYIYIYMDVYAFMPVYIHERVCLYACILYMNVYACILVCTRMLACVCSRVLVYVWTCILVYTRRVS